MSWNKVHVEKFTGFNSTVAAELLPDGGARDILNLRQEKVGKLISRNGTVVGLIHRNANPSATSDFTPAEAYYQCRGVIGIGEFVLSGYWETFDTDRFMVYAVRAMENPDFVGSDSRTVNTVFPTETQVHKLAYLFAPLTGTMQDKLVLGDVTTPEIPTYLMDAEPNGDMVDTKILYAPNREIADTLIPSLAKKDMEHWIERYIHFTQFRNKLVISDRINFDMLLEDDFDRADITACATASHRLRLRPNCVDDFNIDDVELDARLDTGEENSFADGVVTGMALYKFVLPKKFKKPTVDNFSNMVSNPDWTGWNPEQVDDNPKKCYKILDLFEQGGATTLFNVLWARENHYAENRVWWWVNHDGNSKNYYCFSNTNIAEEFDDLLGNPEFPKDEFVDQSTGKVIKQIAPDVYIWEDYRIPYYPSSGKTLGAGRFLTDNDRDFDKLQIGVPRLLDLPEKHPQGKDVPLGVWRYRFVWDFGGGVYSAPSAEMLCPDLMWSATKDDDVESDNNYYRDKFLRVAVDDSDVVTVKDSPYWEGQYLPKEEPYAIDGKADKLICPAIFETGGNLTNFGKNFFDLKFKLYDGLSHKYGVKTWEDYAALQSDSIANKSDFGVLATVFFSKSTLETSGFVWEGVATAMSTNDFFNEHIEWYDEQGTKVFGSSTYFNMHNKGKLVVPIFQSFGNSCTYNSLFDDNGKLRLAYASDPAYIKVQLVMPGLNWGVADDEGRNTGGDMDDPVEVWPAFRAVSLLMTGASDVYHDPNIYLNITCLNDTADVSDMNNQVTGFANKDKRPHTILRAVSKEPDKLTFINAGIDTEALSRLFLTGVAELHPCQPSDLPKVGVEKQYQEGEPSNPIIKVTPTVGTTSLPVTYIDYYDTLDYAVTRRAASIDTFMYDKSAYDDETNSVEQHMSVDDNFNLDVYVYGNGERFTGIEQLSAYFPSSLLHESPRVGIKIPYDKVPARAKRLLIFRSRASHANEFQANEYGLVDTVEIYRESGVVITPEIMPGVDYNGIYYFDKIRDQALDFGVSPSEYEGLRSPIRSALNIGLNERMYFLNYKQTYQPISPRKYEAETPGDLDDIKNFTYKVVTVALGEEGFDVSSAALTLDYKFLYRDANGIVSQSIDVDNVSIAIDVTDKKAVVFYYVPSTFDGTVEAIDIYRDALGTGTYYKIGEVLPEDEGVFVDNNKKTGQVFTCDDPLELSYEGGVMYSQPYRPDWIKPENMFEVRSGDGKQITAVHSLDGNLLIFKETSIHRVAIQGTDPPMSRVDEISPDIGCIAKNANVNVDNTIYFLSNKGFMRFDNNQLQKMDLPFDEELQFVLKHASESDLRDITCGYNPFYGEIYLNIPMLKSSVIGEQYEYGRADYFESRNFITDKIYYQREILGHIYVINVDKQYVTKFGYVPTIDMDLFDRDYTEIYRKVITPNQMLRMYFSNSFGEMRSGDIHPIRHQSIDLIGKRWAGIYAETPHRREPRNTPIIHPDGSISYTTTTFPVFVDTDEILSPFVYFAGYVFDPVTQDFPYTADAPFKAIFKSKFFTGDDESLIKRVRNVIVNIFSRGGISIKNISIARDTDDAPSAGELPDGMLTHGDDRIENIQFDPSLQLFVFRPTINTKYPLMVVNADLKGTGGNVLECVLQNPPMQGGFTGEEDWLGKPVRFSIELEASLRTQINAISFHWRPIHTYLH